MSKPLPQLTEEDIRNLTSEQIVNARKAGQLNEYLGVPVAPPPSTATTFTDEEGHPRAITEADLATMTPEAIVEARRAGRLRHLGTRVTAGVDQTRNPEPARAQAGHGRMSGCTGLTASSVPGVG